MANNTRFVVRVVSGIELPNGAHKHKIRYAVESAPKNNVQVEKSLAFFFCCCCSRLCFDCIYSLCPHFSAHLSKHFSAVY